MVCHSGIPPGEKKRVTGFTRMGEKMVAWPDSRGQATVMSDLCPHRGVALSAGKLIGDCIQYPFHGFEYDRTGACHFIPANGRRSKPQKATEWFGRLGNAYILKQDKTVVITQRPPRPDLDSGEVLNPGDYPIVLYRKRRRALIDGKE